MDPNTILLIAFAVMMLFCCRGLGKFFRRRGDGNEYLKRNERAIPDVSDVAAMGKKQKAGHGGCCR